MHKLSDAKISCGHKNYSLVLLLINNIIGALSFISRKDYNIHMKSFVRIFGVYFTLAVVLGLAPWLVKAQVLRGLPGLAEYVNLEESDVQNGYLVALNEGKYQLASEEYSPYLYGVVALNPAVAVSQIGHQNAYPVVTSGSSEVIVSAANGTIAPGDYITSSTTPGVGMKASEAGFVIGIAQAEYTNTNEPGLITVVIDSKFISSLSNEQLSARAFAAQFQNAFSIGMRAAASEPNTALRYGAAALVLIISITVGFLVFGRAATNGIVAVGRNPLARKSIFLAIAFNIGITVVFAAVGLILALIILAL